MSRDICYQINLNMRRFSVLSHGVKKLTKIEGQGKVTQEKKGEGKEFT